MGFLNVGLSIAPVALPVTPVAAGVSLSKHLPSFSTRLSDAPEKQFMLCCKCPCACATVARGRRRNRLPGGSVRTAGSFTAISGILSVVLAPVTLAPQGKVAGAIQSQ